MVGTGNYATTLIFSGSVCKPPGGKDMLKEGNADTSESALGELDL